MRAFIAIELPREIQRTLGQVQDLLREQLRADTASGLELRWVRPEGIHLTLKFLGEISPEQANQVVEALSRLQPFERFTIQVRGYGFFPDRRRPRVLWAGIIAPPALSELAKAVEKAMASIGFEIETRAFSPHLTLARFKSLSPPTSLAAALDRLTDRAIGEVEVSELVMFESQLSPGSPAQYRKVASFPAR
jgi:2'-5' RNA ligase